MGNYTTLLSETSIRSQQKLVNIVNLNNKINKINLTDFKYNFVSNK